MGKFDKILIISDIDDTFLTKKEKTVPQRNVDAIEYFKSEGGRFTFATGRIHQTMLISIPDAADIANFEGIMANGTYFYNFKTQATFNDKFIDPDDAYELTKYMYEYSDNFGIRFSRPCGTVYVRIPPAHLGMNEAAMHGDYSVDEPYKWDTTSCYKIVLRGKKDELDALRKSVEEKFGDKFEYVKSGDSFFEIQAKLCSKGSAIRELKAQFKAKGDDTRIYACGDFENDLEMLSAADVAACPANATDAVKAIADIQLCHCNDGVIADLIDHIEKGLI